MTSNINPSVPTAGNATTASIRNNFSIAQVEITQLQNAVNNGTPLVPLLSAIAALSGTGAILITGVNTVTSVTVTGLAQSLLADTNTQAMQTTLGLGTAASNNTNDFLLSNSQISANLLPVLIGSNALVTGTSGMAPAPPATSAALYLNSNASWTGLQGNVTGAINGQNNQFTAFSVDNPRYKFIDIGNSGTGVTINMSVAHHQRVTLSTATPSLTITGFPPAGTVYQVVLEIVQDSTGSRIPTFTGSSFKFVSGTIPAWSTGGGKKDIVVLYSVDGGTTCVVAVAGIDFR